jgi:hypothetical protein
VAPALASIDLLLLCLVALSVALLDTPVPRRWALAAVAVLAVPALTAALLTVIFYHCARAYARARRRLEEGLRAQAIGRDMPTG